MSEKKSWRDYSKSKTSEDETEESGSGKKTGSWRDYTSGNTNNGNASGSWRDYSTIDPASIASSNVVNRVNSWLDNHNSYISDYQKRNSGRKYNYEDAYVSDSADWLNTATQRKSELDAEADAIISYLDQNKGYLDASWAEKIKSTLSKARETNSQIVDYSTKDHEWWSGFGSEELVKQYGSAEEAYKYYQRTEGYNTKYAGATGDEIQKALETLGPGEEYDWLRAYRGDVYGNTIRGNADFQDYATIGSGLSYTDFGTQTMRRGTSRRQRSTTTIDKYRAASLALAEHYGNEAPLGIYDKYDSQVAIFRTMEDEEFENLAYCIAYDKEHGTNTAEQYVDLMEETLSYRRGNQIGSKITNIDIPVIEDIAAIGYGALAGMDDFAFGVEQRLSDKEEAYYPSHYANAHVQENSNVVTRYLNSAATNIGNMAPSILVSATLSGLGVPGKVAEAVGSATMGFSASGNAYKEALTQGYDKNTARLYGDFVGAAEGTMQYLLGGISKLGGMSSKMAGKISAIDNALLRGAAKYGLSIGSEIVEEELQNFLEPAFRAILFGEDYDAPTISEIVDTAIVTFLSTGFLEGGGTYKGIKQDMALDKHFSNEYGAFTGDLIQEGLLSDPTSESYQLAQKFQKQTEGENGKAMTGHQIRQLVEANDAQFAVEDYDAAVKTAKERLTELGETQDVDKVAKLVVKKASGKELTRSEKKILVNGFGSQVAKEMTTPAQQTEGSSKAYNVTYKSITERVGEKPNLSVSESGQTTVRGTNEALDLAKADVVTAGDGKMTFKTADGTVVSAEQIDFADDNQSLLVSSVANIENITPAAATAIMHDVVDTSKPLGEQLNGIDEAYTYGYYGYSEADLKAGNFTSNLTSEQMMSAYHLGKSAKKIGIESKNTQIVKMRTAAEAKAVAKNATTTQAAEESSATGYEAPKTKKALSGSDAEVYFMDGKTTRKFEESGKYDDKRMAGVNYAKFLSKLGIGSKYYFYESYIKDGKRVYKDANGNEVNAPNGFYKTDDGSIYIDLNAGNRGDGFTLYTLGHELAHFIKQWSEAKFQVLADFLIEEYGKTDMSMHQRVLEKQSQLEKTRGEKVSYDEAFEEVVADAMSTMLSDGNIHEKLAKLRSQDKGLFNKIKKFFEQLVAKFKKAYAELTPDQKDAQDVRQMKDAFERIQQAFAEALVEASENFQASEGQKNTTDEGGVKYSFVGRTADGSGIYKTNYPLNTPKAVKQADLISLVQNVWSSKPITLTIVENGKYVDITAKFNPELTERSDLSKIAFGNRKGKAAEQRMTLDLASDLYQIAEEARFAYSKDAIPKPNNPAHDGVTKYHYFITNIVYKDDAGNYTPCHMNIDVKRNGDGDWFYSFAIEKGSVPQALLAAGTEKSATLPNDNIPNIGDVVKNESAEAVGLEVDEKTESVAPKVMNSERTWTESDYVRERNKAAKEIANAIGVSEKKAKDYIDSINSIAKMIAEDRSRLDYFSSPGRSSFVDNSEYGGSFDFSTLCKKRRLLTGTFTAIQKALPNTALTADEILDIRNRMKEANLEVSCGLCYVEGSRANMGQFAKEFLRLYKQYYPDAWQPNMADVNTPDGIEWVRINHPECYEQYEYFWNHYGTLKDGDKNLFASQQKPKLYQLHTEYKGEVLQKFKGDDKVEDKNLNGGIRLQSFSDFEIVHLIDVMQIIMDMSRVGLAGQAYTKVPDFAWALGDTGLKINLSLIAKGVDADGKLIFDDVEGMPIAEAMKLRDRYSKNVGTILVAFNDEQLLAAMADDRVDFIIPFHRSQWKKSQYGAMGLPAKTKDYTFMQNEKFIKPQFHEYRGRMVKDKATNYMPNEYWDFSKSGKENAEAYLEMCARNNKRPKFYKLLTNNGDGSYSLKADGSTDGYWKLLIDFKMYDNEGNGSPQMAVKPEFNMAEANRMLNEYAGGHSNFPVAQGIVDDFVKEYKKSHKGVKYSDRDYMAAVNRGDTETAQRMVDEAANKAGYTTNGYHGSPEDFTVVDGDLWLTRDRLVAQYYYGRNPNAINRRKVKGSTPNDAYGVYSLYYRLGNNLSIYADGSSWGELPITEDEYPGVYADEETGDITTNAMAEWAKKNGYDSITFVDVYDGGSSPTTVDVVFNPNRDVKSADPVTYDDNGNVIPLSERFKADNNDIRYSDRDSTGKQLGEDQLEYFEKSMVRDRNGNLQVVYHGGTVEYEFDTTRGGKGSTQYGPGSYFTDSEYYAKEYTWYRGGDVRGYYLNIENMFDDTNMDATAQMPQWKKLEQILRRNGIEDKFIERFKNDGFAYMSRYLALKAGAKTSGSWEGSEQLNAMLREAGFDGIKGYLNDVYQYAIFTPNQAKLTTNEVPSSFNDIRYSERTGDSVSNRSLLANAFEGIVQNSIEYTMLQDYKDRIKELNKLEAKLSDLNREIRKIRFTEGEYDAKKLRELEEEAKNVAKEINRHDWKLLNLEASEPLRRVIDRERKKASQETRDHVKQIQQNKKVRAEQTELRHKIRKAVRDLDKLLNRGNKKLNVKEDMKGFVSKALELADYLFTDHISNDELIRRGINPDLMRGNEAELVKETEEILSQLYDNADNLTDEEFTRLDAKRQRNMEKLRDLLTKQRNERLNIPVYKLFNDLVTEYAKLNNSKQDAVKAAYNSEIERFLRSYIGETESGTDSDRKTLLENMRVADMTTEELWKLHNAYQMVLHAVRTANKLFVKGNTESIEQMVTEIVMDFSSRKIPEKKMAIAMQKLGNKIGWDYEKLYYALDRIGSQAFTDLIMNLANSENIVMQDVMEAAAFRDEIVKKHGFNNWDVNQELEREFLDNTGKKFNLTLGQLMSLYAYSRRESAWDHIEYGGFVFGEAALTNPKPADSFKLSKEQCEAITSLLTKEQKGYVEDMQKFLSETMGEKGNEVSMMLYGIKMFGEKNYFPIHIAGQFKAQAQESQAKAAAGFGSMSNAGFTHAQNPNAKAPFVLEGFNEVWSDHVNEMSRYHGTVPALEDIRRVMNRSSYAENTAESTSVKVIMENHFGKEAVEYFDNLYREANSGAITDKLQQKSKKMLSLFRKNSVAYSLSVLVQQPASLVRAYAVIDRKYFGFKGVGAIISGVAKAVSSKWNKAYENAYNEMLKYAPGVTMTKEIGGFDTATGGSIRSYLLDTDKSFKQKWSTGTAKEKGKSVMDLVDDNPIANLPNVADKIAWIEIWNACKRETVAKHKNLATKSDEFMKIVGDRFTEVIRATQVYDSIFAKSPMLKSKHLAVQMLVSFMNEPNTVANMAESAMRDIAKGNWKQGARTAHVLVHSIIFTGVLKSLIYAMRDDEEDETYIEKYIESLTGSLMDDFNAFNYIPIVRDAWSVAQGYDVERADMAIVADAISALNKVIKTATTDRDGMTEDELIELDKKVTEAGWNLVESLAAFVGIPMKNIRREINAVIDHAKIASTNAGKTSAMSAWDTISEAVIDSIPFMKAKSKQDKLYDAFISGDEAYKERLKGTYKSIDAYNSAVSKALRENDPRIHAAAKAGYEGNSAERNRIFKEIKAEGKFEGPVIVDAINSELANIRNQAEPDKVKSQYSTDQFVDAVIENDAKSAKAMRDDIISAHMANGKTEAEAEEAFAKAVTDSIKDALSYELLDKAGAENMLIEYADKDEEEAASKVSYWAFCKEHHKHKDVFNEANVAKFYEFAEPAEVPVDVYAQFITGTKGLGDIKDEWGDVVKSKREQVLEVIDSLPLTWQQKDALYLAYGYKESTMWDVPW